MKWIAVLALIGAATSWAHNPISDMVTAADRYLKSLDSEQRAVCQHQWKDDKRFVWNFLPDKYIKPNGARHGLRWDKMKTHQQMLAQSLLTSALSSKGHGQAMTIMALEQVLHELEKKNPIRNPDLYYVSVFGQPSATGSWSWRFEGHHLSVNVTIVDGKKVAVTPIFLGGNPGVVKSGPLKGVEVLADEQHLARAFVKSLSADQLKKAQVLKKAPRDILTKFSRKVKRGAFDFDNGIKYAELTAAQKTDLKGVIRVYTGKYRPELLKQLADGDVFANDSLRFAWAGSLEPGKGHYYRIVTDRYLIEYDNVQNNAGHAHVVWRDFDGDFGEDLLLKHHKEAH